MPGVAGSARAATAYVTNWDSGTVTPIEVGGNKPGPEIKVGSGPTGVAITPPAPRCTTNTGTLKLSPGLRGTPAVRTLKIKGTLAGCTGKPFTAHSGNRSLLAADTLRHCHGDLYRRSDMHPKKVAKGTFTGAAVTFA